MKPFWAASIQLNLPGSIFGFPVSGASIVAPNGEINDAKYAFNPAVVVGKQIMHKINKCFVICSFLSVSVNMRSPGIKRKISFPRKNIRYHF